MKYQLIIKNSETGEVIKETITDCLAFVAHGEEESIAGILGNCNTFTLFNVYNGVKQVLRELEAKPGVLKTAKLAEISGQDAIKIRSRHEETLES